MLENVMIALTNMQVLQLALRIVISIYKDVISESFKAMLVYT